MSPASRNDAWRLLTYIQDDLRQTQSKLTELRTMLAAGALDRDETPQALCPVCGLNRCTDPALAEHLANVHGVVRAGSD